MGQMIDPGYKVIGWHVFRIECSTFSYSSMSNAPSYQVVEWCEQHIKGRWSHQPPKTMVLHHTFFIEDPKDAVLFRLTWTPEKVKFHE